MAQTKTKPQQAGRTRKSTVTEPVLTDRRKRPTATSDSPGRTPSELAIKLIECCRESHLQGIRESDDGNEIVLDVDRNGLRCVVLREVQRQGRSIELTPREHEVARMVAQGYPNKTIAGVLEISQWTVGTYLRRVFAKVNVNSRAAMVRRLLEEHLLGGDGMD